tara:strand:- start:331 stop:657 length:327 start_codon:yes stop_codon:yes gene_type:complete
MPEYGEESKKVVFDSSGKKHAEFKIKLQYDGFGQGEFFREVVAAYLSEEPKFMDFVHKLKERIEVQDKRQRDVVKKERTSAENNKKDFALTKDEVESIFDLLERETGI